MTFSDFIDWVGAHIGVSGSTLMFLIFAVNRAAIVVGRRIPNDTPGFWGQVRMICTIIGTDPSSVVTTSPTGEKVTVQDVAAQAATTPPIDAKVEAAVKE